MSLSPKGLTDLMEILDEEHCATQSFETICNKSHHCFKKEPKITVGRAIVFFLQDKLILNTQVQVLTAAVLLHDLYRRDSIETTPFLPVFVHLLTIVDEADAAAAIATVTTTPPPPRMNHGASTSNATDTNMRTSSVTATFSALAAAATVKSADSNDQPLLSSLNLQMVLRKVPPFSIQARNFLSQLVTRNSKELLKKTAPHVINSDPQTYQFADISSILKAFKDRDLYFHEAIFGIPIIMSDPESDDDTDGKQTAEYSVKAITSLFSGTNPPVNERHFVPEMLRLAPPLFACEDELVWLDVIDRPGYTLSYDTSKLKEEVAKEPEAKGLMAQAFTGTLATKDQQLLVDMVEADPKLVHHIGLTPKKFLELVENNPMIAVDILLNMMKCNYKQITDYFGILVNMEMSLHSMEVVNRLTTRADLPTEFIHLYVTNCINTCEGIKDRYMQNRLVRLVCVFLQSLIRNKIVTSKAVYAQVEAFCVEFSRIYEASSLFKLLKNLQNPPKSPTLYSAGPSTAGPSGVKPKTKRSGAKSGGKSGGKSGTEPSGAGTSSKKK